VLRDLSAGAEAVRACLHGGRLLLDQVGFLLTYVLANTIRQTPLELIPLVLYSSTHMPICCLSGRERGVHIEPKATYVVARSDNWSNDNRRDLPKLRADPSATMSMPSHGPRRVYRMYLLRCVGKAHRSGLHRYLSRLDLHSLIALKLPHSCMLTWQCVYNLLILEVDGSSFFLRGIALGNGHPHQKKP
jgi:hypothetical protein